MVTRIAISAVLLTLAGGGAFGQDQGNWGDQGGQGNWGGQGDQGGQGSWGDGGNRGRTPVSAPEIDPAQAVSALMLLGGSVAVLRGRRKKK